ncbi:MAG TPA: hypothetical protein VGB12_02825 [bacterium]
MQRTKWVIGSLAVFTVVLFSPFLVNAVGGYFGTKVEAPNPKAARGTACILPTAEMRQVHMKMFMHTRDNTVRSGMRTQQTSLKNCQTCHPTRGDFCDQCHNFAGVKPECWNCHFYPEHAGDVPQGGHRG